MITIREATKKDCPTIFGFIKALAKFEKLEHEVSADVATLEQNLFGAKPYAFALIAEMNNKSVGFCVYFNNFSTFTGRPGIYIEDIYVEPEYRSLGIGKLFFTELRSIAKKDNCSRLEWWVLDWNQRAIDFYKTMGAEPMSDWTVFRITESKF